MTTAPAPPDPASPEPADPERRAFLRLLGGLWGGVAFGLAVPALRYLGAPLAMRTAATDAPTAEVALSALAADGAWTPVLLEFAIRQGWYTGAKTPFHAFARKQGDQVELRSAVCTHLGCQVAWHQDSNEFICPCHNGKFDANGAAVAGPPKTPLAKLPFQIQGDTIVVALPAEGGQPA